MLHRFGCVAEVTFSRVGVREWLDPQLILLIHLMSWDDGALHLSMWPLLVKHSKQEA